MKMIDKFFDFMNLVDEYNENGRFNIMTRWKILHRKCDIYKIIKNKKELKADDIFNYLFIIDLAKEKLGIPSDRIDEKCSYYVNDNYFKLRYSAGNYSFSISCDKGYSGSDALSLEVVDGENRKIFNRNSIGKQDDDETSWKVANITRIYISYYILDLMEDIYRKRG